MTRVVVQIPVEGLVPAASISAEKAVVTREFGSGGVVGRVGDVVGRVTRAWSDRPGVLTVELDVDEDFAEFLRDSIP